MNWFSVLKPITLADRDAITGAVECDVVNIEGREIHMWYSGKWTIYELNIERQ